jgi:4-amino-4-deoxy-L-arabinose transferase-like glycosyltransferase
MRSLTLRIGNHSVTRYVPIGRKFFPLAVILLVAFLLRLWWSLVVHVDPAEVWKFDMTWYDHVARQLTDGNGFTGFDGEPTAFWPPGYPALLAFLYLIFGRSLLAAELLNVFLGTLTCLLTYAIGSRLFGRGVGLVAAALLALFPSHIFFSAVTLTEVTFLAIFTLAIYLFVVWNDRESGGELPRWLLFGLLLGVASLVRGVALLFLSVPAAVWLISSRSVRKSLQRTVVVAVGLVIVLLPWTIRNYVEMDYPILTSTNGAEAFWDGHWSGASGDAALPWEIESIWRAEYNHLPNPEREIELYKAQMREGIEYMVTHPIHEIKLIPKRIYHLYREDRVVLDWAEDADGVILNPFRDEVLSTLANGYFFAVLGLALVSAPRWLSRRNPAAVFLLLTVAYYTLLHGFLFIGNPRFHAPLLPVFSIMAATGLVALWSRSPFVRQGTDAEKEQI